MKKKTAIIIGASGLTGGLLLQKLIEDDQYESIKLFSRRSINHSSTKVKEFIGEIINLDQYESDFKGDVVFCCIGTTKAKTKDQSIYKAIDYGIPAKAALLSKKNHIKTFMVVSALGADSNSSVFYNRTKGEMEAVVSSAGITNTYILRPSLIVGKRSEFRLGERFASVVMRIMAPLMIGKLKKYRSINAEDIANCMYKLSNSQGDHTIIESDEIKFIANH
ncbi:NAD(P)H-binding protein [Saccharicrinis aurantiacus]|uniref:NAD(P)H-binding protein n=1 Tax=Saccharicrinis aurantiacus TaxID=1849719 RepID=UPI000837EBE8|nr:NAD(P)H-binding protein [Saccharicrinis aurantiacus]